MKAYDARVPDLGPVQRDSGSETLRVAVTFNRPGDQIGLTKFGARMSTETVATFTPDPAQADLAIAELARRGFTLTGRGALSPSMRCTQTFFKSFLKTKFARMPVPGGFAAKMAFVLSPPVDAPWNPDPAVAALLDDVYI